MSSLDDTTPPRDAHVSLDEYATGALPADEQRRAELHIAGCEECRAELETIRRMHERLRNAYEAEPGPSARVRREVMARIARAASPSSRWSLPAWAQIAAIVLIVLQGGALIRTMSSRAPASQVESRTVAQMTRLRVVFAPTATEAQMRALLESIGARIVDGPDAAGAYRIEVSGDPKRVADALGAARARGDVLQSIDVAQ